MLNNNDRTTTPRSSLVNLRECGCPCVTLAQDGGRQAGRFSRPCLGSQTLVRVSCKCGVGKRLRGATRHPLHTTVYDARSSCTSVRADIRQSLQHGEENWWFKLVCRVGACGSWFCAVVGTMVGTTIFRDRWSINIQGDLLPNRAGRLVARSLRIESGELILD